MRAWGCIPAKRAFGVESLLQFGSCLSCLGEPLEGREKQRRWAGGAGNNGDGRSSFTVVLLSLIIRYSAQRHSDIAQ